MASIFTLLFICLLPVVLPLSFSSTPTPPPSTFFPPPPPRRPPTPPPSPPPRRPSAQPPPRPPRKPPIIPPARPPPPHRRHVPPASKPPPPPTPPAANTPADHPQMNNIVDALIGSGDFGNWVDLLMSARNNSSSIPVSATFFVPDDVSLPQPKNPDPYPNQVDFDPFIFAYHVVPKRLTFADLRTFAVGSRLPTLLPGNSLLITNNSFANFSVDGSPITHPDLYLNNGVSVQGVGEAFDYKRFGTDGTKTRPPPPPPPPPPRLIRPPPYRTRETNPGFRFFHGQTDGGVRRSGSDFYSGYWIPLVFGFSIMIKTLLS